MGTHGPFESLLIRGWRRRAKVQWAFFPYLGAVLCKGARFDALLSSAPPSRLFSVGRLLIADGKPFRAKRARMLSITDGPTPMRTMPSTSELDRLVDFVSSQQDGVGLDGLVAFERHRFSRRAMQRRLDALVAQERIEKLGRGRSAWYVRAGTRATFPLQQVPIPDRAGD